MRVILRRERPHPGAQLRFHDVNGYRLTAFATNTTRGQLQDLELRHRRRARVEDRIRIAKDTGLVNLPLHGFDQNRIWLTIVQLALDLTAWTNCSPCTTPTPDAGNPSGSDYASSPSPPPSPGEDGASCPTSRPPPPGPTWSSPATPGSPPHRPDPSTHVPTRP